MTPTKLDRWTIVFVAATASLGAILLGLGQHTLALAIVAAFCAVSSALCTDYLNWFRLPKWLAGPLAFGAVVYGFSQFLVAEPSNQLLVIADLLIYLQLVMFFQRKSTRMYWQILLLSIFQVVVSAALNLYVAFGGLLIIYLFLMLGSAALLFFREESDWHAKISLPRGHGQKGNVNRDGRDTAAKQPHLVSGAPVGIVVYPERREDVDEGINLLLARYLARFGLFTLLLTCLMFFMFPRFGDSSWQGSQQAASRLVGYSGDVQLNEFGEIHESPEEVMRVRFTDNSTGKPLPINREPYFRGDALTHYRPVQGTWVPRLAMPRFRKLEAPDRSAGLVRQTVTLESSEHLFSVVPFYQATPEIPGLRLDGNRNLLVRDTPPGWEHGDNVNHRYEVLTSAFRFGMQRPIVPEPRRNKLSAIEIRDLTAFSTKHFRELARVAEQVCADATDEEDVVKRARRLEAHFRGTTYSYTFNLTEQPPQGVDPIEYFVAEHRHGHCEYFASALALMCRSQGIPARLVVGYRGGDYNSVGKYYLVRELHAHAWVEVYLKPDQVPHLAMVENESIASGAWLRLDPTPGASSDPTPVRDESLIGKAGQFKDFLELLWRDFVVGLNSERQKRVIYEPIMASVTALFQDALLSREWWGAFGETVSQRMGLGSWDAFRERWLSWKTFPILTIAFTLFYLAYRLASWALGTLRRSFHRSTTKRGSWSSSKQLDFFKRWERLARRLQIRRGAGQTHHEMANRVASVLTNGSPDATIEQLTDRLVAAFYAIRFGKQRLTAQELVELDTIVRRLRSIANDRARSHHTASAP